MSYERFDTSEMSKDDVERCIDHITNLRVGDRVGYKTTSLMKQSRAVIGCVKERVLVVNTDVWDGEDPTEHLRNSVDDVFFVDVSLEGFDGLGFKPQEEMTSDSYILDKWITDKDTFVEDRSIRYAGEV